MRNPTNPGCASGGVSTSSSPFTSQLSAARFLTPTSNPSPLELLSLMAPGSSPVAAFPAPVSSVPLQCLTPGTPPFLRERPLRPHECTIPWVWSGDPSHCQASVPLPMSVFLSLPRAPRSVQWLLLHGAFAALHSCFPSPRLHCHKPLLFPVCPPGSQVNRPKWSPAVIPLLCAFQVACESLPASFQLAPVPHSEFHSFWPLTLLG